MDIGEYKQAVIELFKSGKATDEQWTELANICLCASEDDCFNLPAIDKAIYGSCKTCGECLYGGECDHPMLSDAEIAAKTGAI